MAEPSADGAVAVIGHVSDLHLDGSDGAHARAARAAAYLATMADGLDGVLVTGDISDRGSPAEAAVADDYAAARALFGALPVPTVFAPGNHDERTAFARVLLNRVGHEPGEPIDQLAEFAGLRLAVLDSVVPGEPYGCLRPQTLEWLDATLSATPVTPALVALHHPPVPLGLPWLDLIGLRDSAGLRQVIDRHPQVVAILCGHAHSAASSGFAGRPVRVAPGVRSSAALPWERSGGTMLTGAPVGVSAHLVAAGSITTHVRYLPERDERETADDLAT
jgi:3',5'-cyclic-AMP phosphodiesterase